MKMSILIAFNFLSLLLSLITGESSQFILIESMESKTATGKIVFNQIKLEQMENKDIWTMLQSHHGIQEPKWDKIQIRVDKTIRPFKVSYHQLKDNKEIDYKASCLRCHSNGPRYIRPNHESKNAPLSFKDRAKISEWNLLIKSYGEVKVVKNDSIKRMVPLINNKLNHGKKINIKSCTSCHFQGGPRGELSLDNIGTIQFLVKSNQMPPWPHQLTKQDKNKLNELIHGF